MELSIVTTLYGSAPHLREFYDRMVTAAEEAAASFEIVLVNDGSPDDSLAIARRLNAADPRVVVLDLSRNFGHHKAMMTGLAHARGDLVFLLDCDLEEQPELLHAFKRCYEQSDCDVVYGVQEKRKGTMVERVSGRIFYHLFNRLANIDLPKNITTARLMSRRYVEALVLHRDREVFLAGLWAITGFRQVPLPVTKHHNGRTTYTFARRLSVSVNAITAFSTFPLHCIFYAGVLISFLSAITIVYLVGMKLFFARPLQGWTSLIVSVWFIGGLIILFIGIIGIYIAKIHAETKERPYTIVRARYGG